MKFDPDVFRDQLGREVRIAWVRWAREQPNPKPSWLVPYDELSEADKEADRQIGEHVAKILMLAVVDASIEMAVVSMQELRKNAAELVPSIFFRKTEDE